MYLAGMDSNSFVVILLSLSEDEVKNVQLCTKIFDFHLLTCAYFPERNNTQNRGATDGGD